MQIEYTGRQFTITKSLHTIGDEGVERIGKILGRITTAKVVLSAEKYRQSAEITINTRLQSIVGLSESTSMEIALREAIAKAETQAIRYKDRLRAKKRKPKEEKIHEVPPRPHPPHRARHRHRGRAAKPETKSQANARAANGNGRGKSPAPVTVHSVPGKDSNRRAPHRALDRFDRHATNVFEEAVKEAEFRDREVFVFRDNQGGLKVLHRKRDGKMESYRGAVASEADASMSHGPQNHSR